MGLGLDWRLGVYPCMCIHVCVCVCVCVHVHVCVCVCVSIYYLPQAPSISSGPCSGGSDPKVMQLCSAGYPAEPQ